MSKGSITKRELLQKTGMAIAGASVVGTASGQDNGSRQSGGHPTTQEPGSGSGVAGTQALSNGSASFNPWEISPTDTANFDCSWDVFLPFSTSAHRLDAHIEASNIEQPEVNAVGVGAGAIKKDWEYEPDPSPPGIENPTYHYKIQKQFTGLPGTTLTVNLNSEINPTSRGNVNAWVGGQMGGGNLGSGFVGAQLEIE
jgi:hypothetical protein